MHNKSVIKFFYHRIDDWHNEKFYTFEILSY